MHEALQISAGDGIRLGLHQICQHNNKYNGLEFYVLAYNVALKVVP